MEYREGRCPKCGELMQIPVERDKIICMFCGQEFLAEESRAADAAVYEKELDALRECIKSLFTEVEKTVKGFQRTEYEKSFTKYRMTHKEVLSVIGKIMGSAPDKTQAAEQIADMLVAQGSAFMEKRGGKLNYKSEQMTLNMYVVTYVIPAILSIENGKWSEVTDCLCRKWAASFKDSRIQAADFESLCGGFRKKLCYVTTAVCRGLQKPEDCGELLLLKQYRDGYLSGNEEGKQLICEYYDMAPTIVKRMEKREDRAEIYQHLYQEYIAPCVRLIEEGKNEECLETYREMVEMLRTEYLYS